MLCRASASTAQFQMWEPPRIVICFAALSVSDFFLYFLFSRSAPPPPPPPPLAPYISNLQLPSDKFQKGHKKFRMFDKNNDHHIGNCAQTAFCDVIPYNNRGAIFRSSHSIYQTLLSLPKDLPRWVITLTRTRSTDFSKSLLPSHSDIHQHFSIERSNSTASSACLHCFVCLK